MNAERNDGQFGARRHDALSGPSAQELVLRIEQRRDALAHRIRRADQRIPRHDGGTDMSAISPMAPSPGDEIVCVIAVSE